MLSSSRHCSQSHLERNTASWKKIHTSERSLKSQRPFTVHLPLDRPTRANKEFQEPGSLGVKSFVIDFLYHRNDTLELIVDKCSIWQKAELLEFENLSLKIEKNVVITHVEIVEK